MRKPSASMFARMQGIQVDTFQDTANILRIYSGQDEYGDNVEGVTGTYPINCGFFFTNGRVTDRGQIFLVDYDVQLRLDVNQEVQLTDKFQLLTKGTSMVSGTFEVQGYPQIGSTAKTVYLKRITS